jgi:hypothetical protein
MRLYCREFLRSLPPDVVVEYCWKGPKPSACEPEVSGAVYMQSCPLIIRELWIATPLVFEPLPDGNRLTAFEFVTSLSVLAPVSG